MDVADMFEYVSDEETVRYAFERHESLVDTEKSITEYFLATPCMTRTIQPQVG